MAAGLTPAQCDVLASLRDVLGSNRWVLIGASALRCRISLPRVTHDVDLAVITRDNSLEGRLRAAGWVRHPHKVQKWTRGNAQVDVVAVTEVDLLTGTTTMVEGIDMSVVGFDLALKEHDPITLRQDLVVPVPRLPVLALLKMIAWLERPYERQKDLSDLLAIWDEILAPGSPEEEQRWETPHPSGLSELDYDPQGACFLGWQLGRVADAGHLHWVQRFLESMCKGDSPGFSQLVAARGSYGDDIETQLRSRLAAFELGLQRSASRTQPPVVVRDRVSRDKYGMILGVGRTRPLPVLLHDALDRRRVIRFVYQGRPRVVEPHVLGVKDGEIHLLGWQIGGASASGNLPNWRRFRVAAMSSLEATEQSFRGSRWTGGVHSAFDRHIAIVRGS